MLIARLSPALTRSFGEHRGRSLRITGGLRTEEPHGRSGLVTTAGSRERPDRRSGAWVFENTRMPISTIFENPEAGATIDEIMEQFHVTREQIQAVLEFAARSLDSPCPVPALVSTSKDAHTF